ncbi:unnamed protein product [Amoebophrya sp. A25]|nr:unnamed protein product [Amoebophrya sp. A25]|eukprot:GSA25T00012523001.1
MSEPEVDVETDYLRALYGADDEQLRKCHTHDVGTPGADVVSRIEELLRQFFGVGPGRGKRFLNEVEEKQKLYIEKYVLEPLQKLDKAAPNWNDPAVRLEMLAGLIKMDNLLGVHKQNNALEELFKAIGGGMVLWDRYERGHAAPRVPKVLLCYYEKDGGSKKHLAERRKLTMTAMLGKVEHLIDAALYHTPGDRYMQEVIKSAKGETKTNQPSVQDVAQASEIHQYRVVKSAFLSTTSQLTPLLTHVDPMSAALGVGGTFLGFLVLRKCLRRCRCGNLSHKEDEEEGTLLPLRQ